MTYQIPFNKPFIAGKELYYIAQAVTDGNISGDGSFTKACTRLLEDRFGIPKVFCSPHPARPPWRWQRCCVTLALGTR